MKLLIKWPTRGRPDLFLRQLRRYRDYLSGKHEVRFLVTCDEDDASMQCMRRYLDAQNDLHVRYGKSASKIQAVNADMDMAGEFDVLLLASDDMSPVVVDFDEVIACDMWRCYPGLDGALWYLDGRNPEICTMPIMGVNLYRRMGYIYHPSYESLWCDNEYTESLMCQGKLARVDRMLIRHNWLDITGFDDLHQRNSNQHVYVRDAKNFRERRSSGFPAA